MAAQETFAPFPLTFGAFSLCRTEGICTEANEGNEEGQGRDERLARPLCVERVACESRRDRPRALTDVFLDL